jgi:hypothetical protein
MIVLDLTRWHDGRDGQQIEQLMVVREPARRHEPGIGRSWWMTCARASKPAPPRFMTGLYIRPPTGLACLTPQGHMQGRA